MIKVDWFGFHLQEGMIFLHEQGGGRCLSPGLSDLDSPFEVTLRKYFWNRCPHQLPEPNPAEPLDHPLVRAMGPNQNNRVYWVRPAEAHWLWKLAVMTHPGQRVVMPYWTMRGRLYPQLNLTNAAPLVILDIDAKSLSEVEDLMQLPRTRNLILSGPIRLPNTELLSSTGLPSQHDWRDEGARQLHQYIKDINP